MCVQILTGNQKTKSAVFFRLLTQTIEAPKKRNKIVKSDIHKKKKWKRTMIEKKTAVTDVVQT